MRGVAYRIPVPLARAQGTTNADRKLCAHIAAYASALRGETLLGVLRGDPNACATLEQAIVDEYQIPLPRAELWACTINGDKIDPRLIPPSLGGMTLEQYQIDAVARLGPAGGGLALGCGLGKTLAACAYAHAIAAKSIVIVCPLNAMPTWAKNLHLLPVKPLIQSMDSIKHVMGLPPQDLVIFDEAHLQGRMSADRTKKAHQLRANCNAGLCLTGTLLHTGITKAFSVIDLCIPGAAGFSNSWGLGEHFRCLVRKSIGGRTVTDITKPPASMREAYHAYLSKHIVALTKDCAEVKAVLNLPGQDVYDIPMGEPWPSLEQATADYVRDQLATPGTPVPTAAAAAHALCAAGAEAKAEWVIQNLGDDPAVIFAHYTHTLDVMEQRLQDCGITYVRVDGSVTGPARTGAQDKFQAGQVQVFLGQMTAAGISMDLFRSPYSIAMDHPWKPEDYAQALARTHRRGQANACHHWDLIANQLQAKVVKRLRAGEAFNAETAEWQSIKLAC